MNGAGAHDESALELLQGEERSISARRVRLQDRIDFLRSGGGGETPESAQLLAELERKERELSRLRRELHQQIDAMSSQLLGPR